MIKTFKHKGLVELWEAGRSAKIDAKLQRKILRVLDALDAALSVQDLNNPGFDFHALKGFDPTRYTIHVNGPWCITFEFDNGEANRIDFEQYH